jgi:hypothetical protein
MGRSRLTECDPEAERVWAAETANEQHENRGAGPVWMLVHGEQGEERTEEDGVACQRAEGRASADPGVDSSAPAAQSPLPLLFALSSLESRPSPSSTGSAAIPTPPPPPCTSGFAFPSYSRAPRAHSRNNAPTADLPYSRNGSFPHGDGALVARVKEGTGSGRCTRRLSGASSSAPSGCWLLAHTHAA